MERPFGSPLNNGGSLAAAASYSYIAIRTLNFPREKSGLCTAARVVPSWIILSNMINNDELFRVFYVLYCQRDAEHFILYIAIVARNFFSYKLDNFVRMYRTNWHISTKPFWFLGFPLKENWNQTGFGIPFVLLLLWKKKRLRVQSRYTLGNRENIKHQLPKGFNSMGRAYIFFFYLSECPFFLDFSSSPFYLSWWKSFLFR